VSPARHSRQTIGVRSAEPSPAGYGILAAARLVNADGATWYSLPAHWPSCGWSVMFDSGSPRAAGRARRWGASVEEDRRAFDGPSGCGRSATAARLAAHDPPGPFGAADARRVIAAWIARFKNGLMVERWGCTDILGILTQLGRSA
jgi:hypothetical protein